MINLIIVTLLMTANLGILMIMVMVASLVTRKEPKKKTLEEAQADLFKAWGDFVIEEANKRNP